MADIAGTARTNDEAHLYMDLRRCECGSANFPRDNQLLESGGNLISRYAGACAQCGREREFRFWLTELPQAPTRGPVFYGDGPSDLIDPGEWLFIADRYAASVPPSPPADPAELRAAAHRLGVATEAMEQALMFAVPDADQLEPSSLTSADSQHLLATEPGRFRPSRLSVVRDTYRQISNEYQQALAQG